MASPDADEIDFKPFFDMIVGVLFVLLILIAAQMFFSQWGGSPDAQSEREAQQRRHFEWNRQIAAFLDDVAGRLRARGLSVAVDRQARSLVLPLSSLAADETPTRPHIHAEAARALSSVLSERLHCLLGQSGSGTIADCPTTDLLRLGQMVPQLHLDGAPAVGLMPERYGRLLSTLVNAALVQGMPGLLAITGAGGVPALSETGEVSISPNAVKGDGLKGTYALRFHFEVP